MKQSFALGFSKILILGLNGQSGGASIALLAGIRLWIRILVHMLITSCCWLQSLLLLLIIGLGIKGFTLLPRVEKYYSMHP